MPRAVVLVLDSLGIGASADAGRFGDAGADTLGHIAAGYKRRLQLPNLSRLGLFHAHRASTGHPAEGVSLPESLDGAWGYAREISTGKDTPSGHWEIAGVPVRFEWGYFTKPENSFPDELLESLVQRAELPGVLGNCHASGTEIVDRLGAEHVATGKPIVYTSADSVFQIAAHEQAFGLDRLYRVCRIARQLIEPWNIGRIIARPFTGDSECGFERTPNRVDYSLAPPAPTVMQKLEQAGGEVVAVGKIADIYAHQGITRTVKAAGNPALFDATLAEIHRAQPRTLIMTNFVDFDMLYGHRRDLEGYAHALEYFDKRMPELYEILDKDDLLIITADHGCDPTWPGSDHTREHVPVLARGGGLEPGPLGERHSFADIGQTLAAYFDLEPMADGLSFLPTGRPAT